MGNQHTPCRLLPLGAHDGAFNMAVDEALLRRCAEGGPPLTLRLYAWSAPTLSLGYFQEVGEVGGGLARLPMVRRLTGGGAIVHDAELTYSLVWPLASPSAVTHEDGRSVKNGIPPGVAESYGCINRAMSAALRMLCAEPDAPAAGEASRAFLCFRRRSRYDLLVRGNKVAGSAQRRLRGAALQHGSILVGASAARGIRDLSLSQLLGRAVSIGEAADALVRAFEAELGWAFEVGRLSVDQRRLAEDLCLRKYSHLAWGGRRTVTGEPPVPSPLRREGRGEGQGSYPHSPLSQEGRGIVTRKETHAR